MVGNLCFRETNNNRRLIGIQNNKVQAITFAEDEKEDLFLWNQTVNNFPFHLREENRWVTPHNEMKAFLD